jgi:hypothetical protein
VGLKGNGGGSAVSAMLNSFPISKTKVGFRFSNRFSCLSLIKCLRADNLRIEALGNKLTNRPSLYRIDESTKSYTRDELRPTDTWTRNKWGKVDKSSACCFGGKPTLAVDSDEWLRLNEQVQVREENGTESLGTITEIQPGKQYRTDDWDGRLKSIHTDGDFTDVMPIVAVRIFPCIPQCCVLTWLCDFTDGLHLARSHRLLHFTRCDHRQHLIWCVSRNMTVIETIGLIICAVYYTRWRADSGNVAVAYVRRTWQYQIQAQFTQVRLVVTFCLDKFCLTILCFVQESIWI